MVHIARRFNCSTLVPASCDFRSQLDLVNKHLLIIIFNIFLSTDALFKKDQQNYYKSLRIVEIKINYSYGQFTLYIYFWNLYTKTYFQLYVLYRYLECGGEVQNTGNSHTVSACLEMLMCTFHDTKLKLQPREKEVAGM